MALTQGARNKINSAVQAAKKLLMAEFESQLQQYYGIRPDGSSLMVEELTSRDASIIETARLLRQRLHYLEEGIAEKNKAPEAVRQLIREQAFTVLNRFAALRMAEERGIIPDSICKGYNSDGFRVYDQLTGEAKTADQFTRYRWYITHIFDELAIDLPAVFDRYSPYSLLFPSERVVLELLDIINDKEFIIYREEGVQPINLWKSDETIGWMYQYYNSRDEISEMRDASGAPRNSRELAVRNQFFTPRYVVEFLVDNSLGRQWYEMTKGKTSLKDFCQYMVIKEQEVFLEKDASIPEVKIDGANYIEYRPLKDPREILMLDPACGSMHFGLYSFDLFEQIYLEAWDMYPELMQDLREQYMRDDFIKHIPSMILRYNIHGVDIDPRAIQIAGLSLWLRAQRTYNNLNLEPADRPAISKSNLVVAEPMPGDEKLLSDFTNTLPGPIGKLVKAIWGKMQLVGEMGLLLKIEEELKKEIEIAKNEYKEYKGKSAQGTLFDTPVESKIAEMAAIYGKEQKISKDFFDTAEEEVLKALKTFAEGAEGVDAFQKLLFAEDTARGFAFIELSRKRYDVIVMNPPFGESSIHSESYLKNNYSNWSKNILACFFYRSSELIHNQGNYGAIFDRTVSIKSSYDKFRVDCMIGKIASLVDTGWGVLDANVETSVQVLDKKHNKQGVFIDLRESLEKDKTLKTCLSYKDYKVLDSKSFATLPNMIIGYYLRPFVLNLFSSKKNIKQSGFKAMFGSSIPPLPYMRLYWEINNYKDYKLYYNGGGTFSMFYAPIYEFMKFGPDGIKVDSHKSTNLRNISKAFNKTVGYGKRGEILDAHYIQQNVLFSGEGHTFDITINEKQTDNILFLLSLLNSSYCQYILNQYTGQHKSNGYINLIPFLNNNINLNYTIEIIKIKKKWSSIDETNLDFKNILLGYIVSKGLNDSFQVFSKELKSDSIRIKYLTQQNDQQFLNNEIFDEEDKKIITKYSEKRPKDQIITINGFEKDDEMDFNSFIYESIQNLVGIIFKRWHDNFKELAWIKKLNIEELLEGFSIEQSIVNRKDVIQFIENDEIIYKLKNNNAGQFSEFINDLEFKLSKDITEIISNPNMFFQYHYKRFTMSRRVSPIYWPIATASNSFIIWIYYPALSESTLFSIVNKLVDPKIREVAKDVEVLEMGATAKEYSEKRELLNELYNFKEEILRVAQLPYKPNQDDGVLITAAPLHNLFQHAKWRRDTENCWKELEKGDYDWAHLAYSIWPERVREKCKKDLSMAIAHGLEDICDVKPKKTKKKATSSQLKIK